MTLSYWPWKTENNPRFSLVAGTKANHQLENGRHEEDPSFNRTTMEKRRRKEGTTENSYRKLRTKFTTMEKRKGNKGIKENSCGKNERLAMSFETTKK
jgi:hypothetical protein